MRYLSRIIAPVKKHPYMARIMLAALFLAPIAAGAQYYVEHANYEGGYGPYDYADGNIGVYQLYREAFAPPPIKTTATAETGDYALTFFTNDIDKIYQGAKDIGFTIMMAPTVQPNGDTRLIFRGPDGVIEHFIQQK